MAFSFSGGSVHLIFNNVAFGSDSSPDQLFREVSFHLSCGWCGVIGANGAGKSTLLQPACGLLQPLQGSITAPTVALYCPQRTDDPPAEAPAFLHSTERDALLLKDRLAIADDFGERWHTLSHGERKRLQLAVVLWLQPVRITYIPQEIDMQEAQNILAQALALPSERRGHFFAIVSRLNSRPERLLASAEPSPGQVRKLLLALGMSLQPNIIIMDEPTNHLDLPSILCLEQALADCPCALVLVSHDAHFLARLTRVNWSIRTAGEQSIVHVA